MNASNTRVAGSHKEDDVIVVAGLVFDGNVSGMGAANDIFSFRGCKLLTPQGSRELLETRERCRIVPVSPPDRR